MIVSPYAIPAIIAFVAKAALLVYSRHSAIRDVRTRLFVAAVVVSMALNAVEIAGLQHFYASKVPTRDYAIYGYLYYECLIALFALLCHLTLVVAYDRSSRPLVLGLCTLIYAFAFALLVLIASSRLAIADFEPLGGYTVTRVAGPLFFLVEAYTAATLLTVLLLPLRGVLSDNGKLRSRCQIWMMAAAPPCLLLIVVFVLLRLGLRWFNGSVTLPIPMVLLLAAIAYCAHNPRVIEPSSYLPFSKIKRLKRELYSKLSALAQAARPEPLPRLLRQLSETLQCPILLIAPDGSVFGGDKSGSGSETIPIADIVKVERMAITDEPNEPLNNMMRQYRLGAIFPLFPHSLTARSWLVFGDGFDKHVYSTADFVIIEKTIRELAGIFLDKLLNNVAIGNTLLHAPSPNLEDGRHANHPLSERLAHYEAFLIKEALRSCAGNQAQAARVLGIQPNTLHYKLKRLGRVINSLILHNPHSNNNHKTIRISNDQTLRIAR